MGDTRWLAWARALRAIGKTGQHYAANPFDRDRFRQVETIAADILASHTGLTVGKLLEIDAAEMGHTTPRVDVRGAVFREDKILLVREILDRDRWTLPGGWADVNETPAEATVREVYEESGFETRAVKLIAAYDRDRQGHLPPHPYHVYKLFFRCEITGGAARKSMESSEVAFFGESDLPELSRARITEAELRRCFAHLREPGRPADFD
jgi:ADP-ribose pyrophosphatase YjhB (NUDIX family)